MLSRHEEKSCETESKLEGGFPFPGIVCRDDNPVFLSDLANPRDEEFSGNDENTDPDGAKLNSCEVDEGCGNGDFICQWINQLPKGRHQMKLSSQIPVEPIAQRGDGKGKEGEGIPNRIFRSDADGYRKDDDKGNACERDRIGKVRHVIELY